MSSEWLQSASGLITALAALVAGLAGVLGYLNRRDKIRGVREAFDKVIASLASTVEVERMAGAILLRRFFDPNTEVGIAGTPYWKEAVNVTAAILRGRETGHFQKMLADGLAFAPSLERADLQRTNLQNAYLGVRSREPSDPADRDLVPNLSYADFFRADLSGASLKAAVARGAVFYQARLHDTVLRGADLRDANFFEADLTGARFDGAWLLGASFSGARNLQAGIRQELGPDGRYLAKERFVPPPAAHAAREPRVFVSKPGCLTSSQRQRLTELTGRLEQAGLRAQTLEPQDYPPSGALAEIERVMSGCSGAVILGFRQLSVRSGTWRPDTEQQRAVEDAFYPTAWNHVEAGVASAFGLPLLVIREPGVRDGVFQLDGSEHRLHLASTDDNPEGRGFAEAFAAWCADVREQSRRSGRGIP